MPMGAASEDPASPGPPGADAPPPAAAGPLSRAVRWAARALDLAMGTLVVAVTAIAAAQVVLRYVFADAFLWAEEVSVILMVWFVALGAGRMWLCDGHVAVPLLPSALPPAGRRLVLAAFDVAALAAGVALVLAARPLVAVYGGIVLDTLPLSAAWKYGALIGAGAGLAACAALRLAARFSSPP